MGGLWHKQKVYLFGIQVDFTLTGQQQLFDLQNDPHELHDLASEKTFENLKKEVIIIPIDNFTKNKEEVKQMDKTEAQLKAEFDLKTERDNAKKLSGDLEKTKSELKAAKDKVATLEQFKAIWDQLRGVLIDAEEPAA